MAKRKKGRRLDIVLAEDDHHVQELLTELLQSAGLDVAAASSGDEAADLLDEMDDPPRLLLTDINLGPGMNGFSLGMAARRRWPGLPVVYITGVPMNLTTLGGGRTLDPASERFMQKPFRGSTLLATVRDLLGSLPPAR